MPDPAAFGHAAVEVPRELVLAVAARPVVVVEPRAHVADRLRDQPLVLVEQLVLAITHEWERTGCGRCFAVGIVVVRSPIRRADARQQRTKECDVGDRRRLREIAATILLVIGGIGLVVASTGWWLERNYLHTSRFTATANRLLDQDEVQAELSRVLVRQLSETAGTNLQVAGPFLASIVSQVVESDAFRTVFDTALSNAHRVLVDRETGTIILNLTEAYDQIKSPLEQVAPKLAAELPSRKQLQLVLLHRSQLTTIWDVIDKVKRMVGFLTIGAGLLLVAGVALRGGRLARLVRGAWIVAGTGALLIVVLFVRVPCCAPASPTACSPTRLSRPFRVITTPLLVQTSVVVIVAIVVALAARYTATAGLPAWRPAVRGAWTTRRARAAVGRG